MGEDDRIGRLEQAALDREVEQHVVKRHEIGNPRGIVRRRANSPRGNRIDHGAAIRHLGLD